MAFLGGCGATHKAAPPTRAAVPDVRGQNLRDAVSHVLDARYCVRLRAGTRVSLQRGMRVQRQAPPPGTTGRPWAAVTLTIGVPTPPGTPAGAKSKLGVDTVVVWGGRPNPCPRIQLTS
jgi:hypothetical protein